MTRITIISAIFLLIIGGYASAIAELLADRAERPRLCAGLTAHECTAAAQDAKAAIAGGW